MSADLRAAAATLSDLALHGKHPALAEAALAVRAALAAPQQAAPAPDVTPEQWAWLDEAAAQVASNAAALNAVMARIAERAAPAGQAAAPAEKPTRADLLAALQWYADGLHFDKASPDAWDTVSGEPQNWWCDEAGTATVEDGTLAGMVLAGKLTGAQLTALEDGEVIPEQAPTAPASTPQAAERGG